MAGPDRHGGSCRCGHVRLVAAGDPIWTAYCHCADCRKATGAPVSAFVGFKSADVSVDGVLTRYGNGPVARSFCPRCGTPMLYRDERLVGEIYVMVGAMDAPERYAPTVHGFAAEKLPWLSITDSLPHDSGFTRRRPDKGRDQ